MMNIEQIKEEELRLNLNMEKVKSKISMHADSAEAMLNYLITFSELMKNALIYFTYALDTEKQDLVSQIFTELSFNNENAEYKAKQGFAELLSRHHDQNWSTGSALGDQTCILR
jgi:hypothetical protein